VNHRGTEGTEKRGLLGAPGTRQGEEKNSINVPPGTTDVCRARTADRARLVAWGRARDGAARKAGMRKGC